MPLSFYFMFFGVSCCTRILDCGVLVSVVTINTPAGTTEVIAPWLMAGGSFFHTELDFTAVHTFEEITVLHRLPANKRRVMRSSWCIFCTCIQKLKLTLHSLGFIQSAPCHTGSCIFTPPGRRQNYVRNPRWRAFLIRYYQRRLEHLQGPISSSRHQGLPTWSMPPVKGSEGLWRALVFPNLSVHVTFKLEEYTSKQCLIV